MRSQIETAAAGGEPPGALEAAMDRLFGEGVRPLRLEEAVFAAMLDGWERQKRSRMLRPATISSGVRLVRRVRASAERWPWVWTAADVEDFISDLASAPHFRRPAAHPPQARSVSSTRNLRSASTPIEVVNGDSP